VHGGIRRGRLYALSRECVNGGARVVSSVRKVRKVVPIMYAVIAEIDKNKSLRGGLLYSLALYSS